MISQLFGERGVFKIVDTKLTWRIKVVYLFSDRGWVYFGEKFLGDK